MTYCCCQWAGRAAATGRYVGLLCIARRLVTLTALVRVVLLQAVGACVPQLPGPTWQVL